MVYRSSGYCSRGIGLAVGSENRDAVLFGYNGGMRTAHDQWDIASSVGWTALMVAAGRAVETHRADGLVDDPYAEDFVARAQTPQPLPTRPEQRWPDAERVGDERTVMDELWSVMCTYQGIRSRFFDTVLATAAGDGVDQVVLLAAGLDARALRLDWPTGTTLFELDQAGVLEFKDAVLAETGAAPRCDRRRIAVDLREDWPAALRAAGFDPGRPSAWLAEGLLPFLPAGAEAELFERIGALAAPGSTITVEHFGSVVDRFRDDPAVARFGSPFGVDMSSLVFVEERDGPGPADRLGRDAWSVRVHTPLELAERYRRALPALSTGTELDSQLITARR
jgi:methyltransferase (TIGR00027 family)